INTINRDSNIGLLIVRVKLPSLLVTQYISCLLTSNALKLYPTFAENIISFEAITSSNFILFSITKLLFINLDQGTENLKSRFSLVLLDGFFICSQIRFLYGKCLFAVEPSSKFTLVGTK